ncbi:hypothetical protein FOZ60_010518 [Perkinsus olseni]|uniref:Uncharacterized protein n=4 Tax=Perkinsus olseni TaxID=32597 RepID=A0A7J6PBL8_PEROL|nr:hypothetical protein FOZ60_010518 [Perkinsus olseni]
MVDRTRSSTSAASSTGQALSGDRHEGDATRNKTPTTEDFLTYLDTSCAELHSRPDVMVALLAILKEEGTPAQRKLVLKSNEALNVLLAVGFDMDKMKVLPGMEVKAEVARDMLNVQLEQVAQERSPSQIEALLGTGDGSPLLSPGLDDRTAEEAEVVWVAPADVEWPEVKAAEDWQVVDDSAPRRRLQQASVKADDTVKSAQEAVRSSSEAVADGVAEGSSPVGKSERPEVSLMQVVCPEGYDEGSNLQAQTPDGQTVRTSIPEGVRPGDAFIVRYTPRPVVTPVVIQDEEKDDEAVAEALQQSFDEAGGGSSSEEASNVLDGNSATPTSSRYLSTADIAAMGLYFECQGNGTATCAIHALNNLAQRKAVSLTHLQAAESRVALLQRGGSFLAPSGVSVPSSASGKSGESARTGWFDIEALKLASEKHAAHVIIETEPIPEFARSAGQKFVTAANEDHNGNGSWFRGFLVYECIPGRAMHYWSLLRLPAGAGWVKMDSLHRDEDESPGHRCKFIATDEELAGLYDGNKDYFKSWLMRWYPVVDEDRARESLKGLLHDADVSSDDAPKVSTLNGVLRDNHWIPSAAAHSLLVDSVTQVAHMAQALCLVVSSSVAVKVLRATEWDWDRAVHDLNEVLAERRPDGTLSSSETRRLAQSCLATSKWDVHTASIVMHIVNSYGTKDTCAGNDLQLIAGCVKACEKDLEKSQLAYRLLRVCCDLREKCADPPSEAASVLSTVDWDVDKACVVIQVHENLNDEPPYAVCAEASKREDFGPTPATELLKEFRRRVQTVASQTATEALKQAKGGFMDQLLGGGPPGEVRDLTDEECAAIADWALRQGQWQPHDCFQLAERMANRFVRVRCELSDVMTPDADVVITSLDLHDMDVAAVCADLRKQRQRLDEASFESSSFTPQQQQQQSSSSSLAASGAGPKPGASQAESQAGDFNSDCSLM